MSDRSRVLRSLICSSELSFLMEAHDGISAKIVEEAGFKGIWGSGLTISSAMGVRDNNEASWTQVVEIVEFMADAVSIPILLDGDTGYGNFNNFSRVVRKLEQRGCSGVCIEDKLFPKTNSFIDGERQALADVDEFVGKIKAGKDSQADLDFVIVARVEAFIAGWGLSEALRRAEAYREAGADAILMHSKLNTPDEILAFTREWCGRLPVVIVPTKYYSTPVDVFRRAGVNTVIWANHLMRSAVAAMQKTAKDVHDQESVRNIEDKVAPVSELFRLQGADDLRRREDMYLPRRASEISAVILAASQGKELRELTKDIPKALLEIGGRSILSRTVDLMNSMGVKNISVVRGFAKDQVDLPGISCVDNDRYEETQEVYSLGLALRSLSGQVVMSYGDILYKKHVLFNLLESKGDITIAVDAAWESSQNKNRYAEYVVCSNPYDSSMFDQDVRLCRSVDPIAQSEICGEWIGLACFSAQGTQWVNEVLSEYEDADLDSLRMRDLLTKLVEKGFEVHVQYVYRDWLDVDDLYDLRDAQTF